MLMFYNALLALQLVGYSTWHSTPRPLQHLHWINMESMQIHRHIKSFPTIESLYGKSNSSKGKKYLSSQLSVASMHELYLEMHEPQEYAKIKEDGSGNPQVKYDFYREYFNSHFNLSFGAPKTDTCATCDELNVKINDASDSTHKEN